MFLTDGFCCGADGDGKKDEGAGKKKNFEGDNKNGKSEFMKTEK